MGEKTVLYGFSGEGKSRLTDSIMKSMSQAIEISDKKSNNYKGEFNEQKHYWDVLNKINNVRYKKPVFIKCKSCGFEVVDTDIKDGKCTDCREGL